MRNELGRVWIERAGMGVHFIIGVSRNLHISMGPTILLIPMLPALVPFAFLPLLANMATAPFSVMPDLERATPVVVPAICMPKAVRHVIGAPVMFAPTIVPVLVLVATQDDGQVPG